MKAYKVVAILSKSAGNSEVGDMWQEVFESTDTINDVIMWAKGGSVIGKVEPLQNRLQLQIAAD